MISVSFSLQVKNELARITGDTECCHVAELASLMRMGGTMLIGAGRSIGINFVTANAAVARKALTLIKKGFNLQTSVVVSRQRRFKKNNSYAVKVAPSPVVSELLERLGLMQDGRLTESRDVGILRKPCCRRSYLRGAFLGGGSINRPAGEYHLELVAENREFAQIILRLLKALRLPARISERKNTYIVYLKEGDAITSFLSIVGAHQALMEFENVRVVKDMRNQVNRLVNCETANLQKTVDAAVRQVAAINLLIDSGKFDKLPRAIRQTAELRLEHPEATLTELVQLDGAKVSRSGISHRLRKLEQLAEDEKERNNP